MPVTRGEAVETFATTLRELRESVGNPSFREMSGRSRAISHTTLHEAAQGNRLPSWSTTVEFVKACGADPADYRERWDDANRAVRGGTDAPADDAPADSAQPEDEVTAVAAPNRRRLWFATAGAVAVVVIAVVIVIAVRSGSDPSGSKPSGVAAAVAGKLGPDDCPVHQTNPPPAPATHSGDASVFITDITLPDCTHIQRGATVQKVWRLKNVGTVPWTGYSLHRLDLPQRPNQCQTISDIPIKDTAPGHVVDIGTDITAPNKPGFCFARFKMQDAAGQVVFPGRRPVTFQLIVS